MHRNVLTHFPWMSLALLGQLLFLSLFLGALAWVFRKGSGNFYERLARLPIDEGGRPDER